jgi:nucleotide-binding universal stress UspA family protein
MTVVVGVDGSPVSTLAVERGIQLASSMGTDLHVVHVAHLPVIYTDAPIDWTAVLEADRKGVWNALDETISSSSVPVQRVDLEGYPAEVLTEYCETVNAKLLVVGNRGRGDVASLLLGSTSHRAIQLARCDVLVVKDVEEDE